MPENQCPQCAKLRAELAEQLAQFDGSWRELLAERDALRASVDAFQEEADRRGGWRAWLPWLIAAALFGVGLWLWVMPRGQ
jgi:hypothetical protein